MNKKHDNILSNIDRLLVSIGVDPKSKTPIRGFPDHWKSFNFKKSDGTAPVRVLLIDGGPKNSTEVRSTLSRLDLCIAIFRTNTNYYTLFLKVDKQSFAVKLENDLTYTQLEYTLDTCEFSSAEDELDIRICINKAIQNIPTQTSDFNNRGIFSTHYLKTRFFDDLKRVGRDITKEVDTISALSKNYTPDNMLAALGWNNLKNNRGSYTTNSNVSIVAVDPGIDLGTKTTDDVAPSYKAISELQNTAWVILTNGKIWRLYTNKISASTTNYFEINLGLNHHSTLLYLVAIFGALSYVKHKGKTGIDLAFKEGKTYARALEKDLASKILQADGIFLDLVKGILKHDKKMVFTSDELDTAKKIALKIMYRIWFLLYAESRDLLPVKDAKYRPVSLQHIKNSLDEMEINPKEDTCWSSLLKLFSGVRNGSKEHNLPQYNGELFRHDARIDDIEIKNKFIVRTLRGLSEKDGESVDYASLSVRHLGSIYETLMEFSVKQASTDMMLLEDAKGVREVESKAQSTYSYKKNDLYLASKVGIASRKKSGNYYTPEELVEFLVKRGLEPIFEDREKLILNDLTKYNKNPSEINRRICLDRLLDIQVLDPSMGSGHFLVESLNKITKWVTSILQKHPTHPLLNEIESDRQTVIYEQKQNGIKIDQSLLTHDVLLKRKVMKRCIFGVDINPLAVELARLSLWLDSFAIGVPLTYLNHHIKIGDSTIGMWRDDLKNKDNHSLDDWSKVTNEVGNIITKVSSSADITIKQVRTSEQNHIKYEDLMTPHNAMLNVLTASKIDKDIIPKKTIDVHGYVTRFGELVTGKHDKNLTKTHSNVQRLSNLYHFFHWELEMMDAFTDTRRGFDLIVGNPPWDKVKPSDDEFFTPYDPKFRLLQPNTKKKQKMIEILKDPMINKQYELYKKSFHDLSMFYKTFKMQGTGDFDLWQLIFERTLDLVADKGVISMILPSQILSNNGSANIRKAILDKNILSLYVFENKKKIFPIDSRYKFALLTMRYEKGSDKFPAGFYLHSLSSLDGGDSEKEKFTTISKKQIKAISPVDLAIPETGKNSTEILSKLSKHTLFIDGLGEGWNAVLSRGFDRTNDADLLKEDGCGWPVLQGRNIHQFMHNYTRHAFTASKLYGLRREKKRKIFQDKHEDIHNSFRLIFRQISSPTNMRTIIASIIPPQRFFTHSLQSIIITHNQHIRLDMEYNKKIVYLCGLLNSMTFDFIARSKIQMNTSTVIPHIPIPKQSKFDENITQLAAKLSIGTDEFEPFATSFGIKNTLLNTQDRIECTARLDALVAHAYELNREHYETIINSFKFGEDPTMLNTSNVNWSDSNSTMRNFYGEVRKLVLNYYDEYVVLTEVDK